MVNKEKFWPVLCEKIERPALAADPRFCDYKARLTNRAELTRLLDDAFAARPTSAWLEEFAGTVPAAPVYDVAQALENDFVRSEDRVWTYPHPTRENFRMVAPAFRFPGEDMPRQSAPAFGADTDAVLREIGYAPEKIAALRAKHVV